MKTAFIWLYIMAKRQLKRPSTIFISLCMVISIIVMRYIPTSIDASINIGYCMSPSYEDISDSLLNHEGLLIFIPYTDTYTLSKDVTSGAIQCGYVFGDNLDILDKYTTPNNPVSLLSDVVILSIIMTHSADDMLIEDILNQRYFKDMSEEDINYIRHTYEIYASGDKTFSFDYRALYDDYAGSSSLVNIAPYLITPMRGTIAIFIFIAALAAGVGTYRDINCHIYANIPLRKRPYLRLLNISIPAFLSGTLGLIGIIIVGISDHILYECFSMLVYALLCTLFSFGLTYILKDNIYYSLLPVFILGSVICCPIFFNLGNIIPTIKVLQHLFLHTYYFAIFF